MILLLGSGGMLGTEVNRVLVESEHAHDVMRAHLFEIPPCDPELIINCAGAIIGSNPEDMISINAQVPAQLRSRFPLARIVYISTDCVFSGKWGCGEYGGGDYSVDDIPDPDSIYGVSKRAGEFFADLVIRTSFIGFRHGLLRWAIDHKGQTIEGWRRAFWSGSTVDVVAKHIVDLALGPNQGIEHLSTENAISKCKLLEMINKYADLNLDIQPRYKPEIDRSLAPTTTLPPLKKSLEQYITSAQLKVN